MIFDAIFNLFFGAINGLLEFIPVIDPFPTANVENNLVGIINNVSCFVPVGTFYIVMSLWLVFANLDFVMSCVHWVIRKIPTIS